MSRAPRALASSWLALRARIAERIGEVLGDGDAAALVTALAIGERYRFTEQHWADFRRTGTSHLVAVSGLPIGLQILGRPWDEARVLRIGRAFEREHDFHRRTPPLRAA